jgi:hypothetical protein
VCKFVRGSEECMKVSKGEGEVSKGEGENILTKTFKTI